MTGERFGAVLLRRAARLGQRHAARVARRLGDHVGESLPGVRVEVERSLVRLSARGLRHRWIGDAALRWLGRLLR